MTSKGLNCLAAADIPKLSGGIACTRYKNTGVGTERKTVSIVMSI